MSGVTDMELILSAVLVAALIGVGTVFWHVSGRYLVRLQLCLLGATRENAQLVRENDRLRGELAEAETALRRATDGDGRWTE